MNFALTMPLFICSEYTFVEFLVIGFQAYNKFSSGANLRLIFLKRRNHLYCEAGFYAGKVSAKSYRLKKMCFGCPKPKRINNRELPADKKMGFGCPKPKSAKSTAVFTCRKFRLRCRSWFRWCCCRLSTGGHSGL